MATINDLKQLETPGTPLFLFECTLTSGDVQLWSTHKVSVDGKAYLARILKHNLFDLRSSSDEATDGISKITITLANADAFLSSIERNVGWKGAQLTIRFLFFNLKSRVALSESAVVFRGVANPPDQSDESSLQLSFMNRLSLQRVFLPEIRIQRRCPWSFPADASQLQEAVDGGAKGRWSQFYRCGYSAGQSGGVGNLNGSAPYTSCDYTRAQCVQRGMFDRDSAGHATRRFGGIEFVPASVIVRSYGEKGSHLSTPLENQARYNDFVPLIYGTGWYKPPVVFARNDGNLTRTELLLGAGEISSVLKVIVNDIEIPAGVAGSNMTATGWYNVVTAGTRTGAFNLDFSDSSGKPLGDPYGSMALLSVVVPNRISDGRSLPKIDVLIQGMKLSRYDAAGAYLDDAFTNNPAWVLLDVLRRSGWSTEEVDLASFAAVATACDELIPTVDLNGKSTLIPRFQCNLILADRRSVADVVRGIRNGSSLYLAFDINGRLQVNVEDVIAKQQPTKPDGTNSTEALNGGWPAYEFGDDRISGILRKANGAASLSVSSRNSADTPNLYTVEFQDEFNEYQHDSLSLVDVDDALLCGQEITAKLSALGLPNYDQATRLTALQLNKSVYGNTYAQFETSVRAVKLRPGDIITLTYSKEGFQRQPFRVIRISPGVNYRTAVITAQIHDDEWYSGALASSTGAGRQPYFKVGLPRPLVGSTLDADGNPEFGVVETSSALSDGSVTITLAVSFSPPAKPTASNAGVPLLGLNPRIDTTGGSLAGNQNLYYAVSAVDANGAEGGLSFQVKATVPAGTNTNQVIIPSLSFSSHAESFNVYRGPNPSQLLRIADNVAIAGEFTDSGAKTELQGPPDYNFDHANFYWRFELQPEEPVDIHSANTIGSSPLNMLPGDFNGATVRVTKGTGARQERVVSSNTATILNLATNWDVEPDETSVFLIADSTWQFGASGSASPVSFNVPNRDGATIQISGRAANVRNEETAFELSPLTSWRISGDGGDGQGDADVPAAPAFGLFPTGQGTVELVSIGFTSLDNTATIAAGTLTLAYWDELSGPSSIRLASAIGADDTSITVASAGNAQPGDLVQIESEVLLVQQASIDGSSYGVQRGSHGTAAATHAVQTAVYFLEKKTFVLPFGRGFFGSLASGSYAYPVFLPDARIAAAELFMTNSRGNSDVTRASFTSTSDTGIRTMSGGQMTIQMEGLLAIQSNVAPPLLVEAAHSVRDVYAVVQQAPTGTPIELQITQNGQPYCSLTVPEGSTISNVMDGFALGPLQLKANLELNITSVSQTPANFPGRDLTVMIRL
jgi:putative tail protein